jgi:hypothetical protein
LKIVVSSSGAAAANSRPGEHRRPHRVQAVLERGDDAKVPAAAAHTPEQVGVDALARGQELTVGRDEIDGKQVVDGGAVFARQPADAPAERQARDAGVGDDPAHGRQPVELRLAVELAPEHAGLRPRRSRLRVDPDALHRREVDHEPPIADRMPGDAVTTGANRDHQITLAREAHCRDHVGHTRAASDAGRMAVDRAIPDHASSVVAGARRQQQLSAERSTELVERDRLQGRCLWWYGRPGSHASNVGLPARAD